MSTTLARQITKAIRQGDLKALKALVSAHPNFKHERPRIQGPLRRWLTAFTPTPNGELLTSHLFTCIDYNQPKAVEILFDAGLSPIDSEDWRRRYKDLDGESYPAAALSWAIHQNNLELALALTRGTECFWNNEHSTNSWYKGRAQIPAQLKRKALSGHLGLAWVNDYLRGLIERTQAEPLTPNRDRVYYTHHLVQLVRDKIPLNPGDFVPLYQPILEGLDALVEDGSIAPNFAMQLPFFTELAKLAVQNKIYQSAKLQAGATCPPGQATNCPQLLPK